MKITVFRVDDRLIHGQIVTAWLNYAEAKIIVCADDTAAKDEFQKTLLQMATPKNVELKILSVDEAIKFIEEDNTDNNALLLVRGTNEAAKVIEQITEINSVNIGNINMKAGKTKILSNVWVDENDIVGFKKLKDLKVSAEVRAVPNDKSQNIYELLQKNNLM